MSIKSIKSVATNLPPIINVNSAALAAVVCSDFFRLYDCMFHPVSQWVIQESNLEFAIFSPDVLSMLSLTAAQPQKCCGRACGLNMEIFCKLSSYWKYMFWIMGHIGEDEEGAEREDSLSRSASHMQACVNRASMALGWKLTSWLTSTGHHLDSGDTHTHRQWGTSSL